MKSPISAAFADAQAIDLAALTAYPLPVLRRVLGLAKGIERRSVNGAYEQVREVIERAIKAKEGS